MNQIVIFPNDTGDGVVVLAPTGELPITEVARKDVPEGVPYKIIDSSVVPEDRYFRDAWVADFSNPDGYGMGHDAWTASRRS